jgi:hypothetical protein
MVIAFAASALPAGAAGTGNIASESAQQIVTQAASATKAATSVTVKGWVVDSGQKLTLNITTSNSGQGQGTITQKGQTITLRITGGNVYLMADTAFWTAQAGAAAAKLFANKWVYTSLSDPNVGDLTNLFDTSQFFSGITGKAPGNLTTSGTANVNGQKAVVVKGSDSSGSGTMYVAATGNPYILKVTTTGSANASLTFSNYNKPVNTTAPKGAINLNQLSA